MASVAEPKIIDLVTIESHLDAIDEDGLTLLGRNIESL